MFTSRHGLCSSVILNSGEFCDAVNVAEFARIQGKGARNGITMLRITVHDNPRALTFQLEGRLTRPWLRELEDCWQSTLARQPKPILRVDLTGVTFIDAAGKACLAAMHRQGAEFITADCLTKAIVAEITH
jgi:ABC-type transporter Mla MlaB component